VKGRRQARVLALQALYEADVAHHDPARALEERLEETPVTEESAAFARGLVEGIVARQVVLDTVIRATAPNWPLDQMARIDVCILRLGIYEVSFAEEAAAGIRTPQKVAINEAVELAKLFGSESSGRFVNGVLGSVAKHPEAVAQAVAAAQSDSSAHPEDLSA
jgi:transcription antitermination protein NusB